MNLIIKYGLKKKCVFINFENLFNNVSVVKRKLRKALRIKPKIREYVDNKISKFTNKLPEMKEYTEGFFKYLDNLHLNLKNGYISNEVCNQCLYWNQNKLKYADKKHKYILQKYTLDLSFLKTKY